MHTTLLPEGWPRPPGYSNGVAATGRHIFVGGQIGWNAALQFESDDLAEQVRQTLANVVAVLKAGGAAPEHVTMMTWYVTDIEAYRNDPKGIGRAYREVMGKHFPAMAVVQVPALVEKRAKVEIQAHAVLPA